MKALTFSAPPDATDPFVGVQGLRDICAESGIELIRYSTISASQNDNPAPITLGFSREVNEADLFVFEGNLFWLKFFSGVPKIADRIIERITTGTPFVFQSVRGWESYFRDTSEQFELIRRIYKTIKVQPTNLRVFSSDVAAAIGGGSEAFFRDGDNCLLSGELFSGVSELVIGQGNIIALDFGAYPVIETGTMHTLTNDGDLPDSLDLNVRPAVAAEVRSGKTVGLVFGGRFLSDSYEALGGPVTGIEMNDLAVRKVIEFLRRKSREPRHHEYDSDLFVDMHDLERGLGRILVRRLDGWSAERLKDQYLRDIIEICFTNYTAISDLFPGIDRQQFAMRFRHLSSGPRLLLSHPIQAEFGRELNESQKAALRDAAALVRRACTRI